MNIVLIIKIGTHQLNMKLKIQLHNVGLYELSPFSKYEIKGDSAHYELQKICTANIKNEIGRSTYTQMLNEAGGIETDLTVICIDRKLF